METVPEASKIRQARSSLIQIAAASYGLPMPLADNVTPEGRAINRRIVFVAHSAG
jgi:outer membrane protein OmpA-like peptidoglycan-associated protein